MVYANYVRTLNIDEPLARIKSDGTIRYYHPDALGSIIALTDDLGNVKTEYNYSPFGETELTGEPSDNPFQYTGRENDLSAAAQAGGTGLYYYRARYYSPELKRFVSEDPIGIKSEEYNFHVYVGNNPFNRTDPYGLKWNCKKVCNFLCGTGWGFTCGIVCMIVPPGGQIICWPACAGTGFIHCDFVCSQICADDTGCDGKSDTPGDSGDSSGTKNK